MDEDDFLGIMMLCAFMLIFLLFPIVLVLSISACTAWSRTRKWAKEQKNRRLNISSTNKSSPEHESLVSSTTQDDIEAPSSDYSNETEEDLDDQFFIDTDDEEDYKAQRAEERADRLLTMGQKFRKEFRKNWSGSVAKRLAREREREERRKIAKTVARVIELADRRRAKRDADSVNAAGAGPSSAAGSTRAGAADDLLPRYETAIAEDRKA